MNNDLISRKQVIETAERVFAEYRMSYGGHHGGFAEAISEAIRNIPTAYDVDKVVERLEERKKYLLKEFVLAEKAEKVKEITLARINEIDGIIEIVKVGGLNENQRSEIKDT